MLAQRDVCIKCTVKFGGVPCIPIAVSAGREVGLQGYESLVQGPDIRHHSMHGLLQMLTHVDADLYRC